MDSFLDSTRISLDPKGDTPLSAEKTSHLVPKETNRREKIYAKQDCGKGKEVEGTSPSQQVKKKGKKLHFSYEIVETQNLAVKLQDQQPKDYMMCTHNPLNIHLKVLVKISFSQVKRMK